jgi:hypothetical protein
MEEESERYYYIGEINSKFEIIDHLRNKNRILEYKILRLNKKIDQKYVHIKHLKDTYNKVKIENDVILLI